MKPINSKEKSKQLWQFVLIFLGLALVPVSLIFFSYYHVPEEISESETRRLVAYSNFDHSQKMILKKMAELDTNLSVYASANVPNPAMLEKKIADGISELSKGDTTIPMVQIIRQSYENHFTHVRQLVLAQAALKSAQEKQKEAEEKAKAAAQASPMGTNMRMTMPQ